MRFQATQLNPCSLSAPPPPLGCLGGLRPCASAATHAAPDASARAVRRAGPACRVLQPEAPLCQVLTLNIVTLVYMLFMQSQFWKREARSRRRGPPPGAVAEPLGARAGCRGCGRQRGRRPRRRCG